MIEKSNLFNQLQQHEGKVTESPLVTKLLEPEVLPSISGGNYAQCGGSNPGYGQNGGSYDQRNDGSGYTQGSGSYSQRCS